MIEVKSSKTLLNIQITLVDKVDKETVDDEHDAETKTQENQSQPVRNRKAPTWLQDYETAYVCILEEQEPASYKEACRPMNAVQWWMSTKEEM